jgi:hypothetical protein
MDENLKKMKKNPQNNQKQILIKENENKVKWQISPKLSPTKLLVHNFWKLKKTKEIHIELSPYFLCQGSFKLCEPPLVPEF